MKREQAPLPSKALSISLWVGKGLFLSRAYMDITIPGVQNPHWDPWHLEIRSLWNTKQQIKTTRLINWRTLNSGICKTLIRGLKPTATENVAYAQIMSLSRCFNTAQRKVTKIIKQSDSDLSSTSQNQHVLSRLYTLICNTKLTPPSLLYILPTLYPELSLSVPDTDQISKSPVQVTKSPRQRDKKYCTFVKHMLASLFNFVEKTFGDLMRLSGWLLWWSSTLSNFF